MNTPNAKDKNKNEVVAPVSKELWAVMEPGKHALQFQCDWAVYPVGTHASLCYATSEERARWISDRLNELRAVKASSTLPTEAPPVTREEWNNTLELLEVCRQTLDRNPANYNPKAMLQSNCYKRVAEFLKTHRKLAKPKAVAQGQPPARDEMPPAALLPCPHCGSSDVVTRLDEGVHRPFWNARVVCRGCWIGTDRYNLELHYENMIADWNRRAAQTPDGSNNDSAPAIPKEDRPPVSTAGGQEAPVI
jgi:hypothetical protein